MKTITPLAASRRVLRFAKEGRLVQGSWHRDGDDGRHFACLLGSMSNGVVIDAPEKCPATIMPEWMAHLVVGLFDGQEREAALAWGMRLGTQMGCAKWATIEWERVRVEFLIGTMAEALEAARKVRSKEAYWPQVEHAHKLVREALRGNGDLSAARSAARSAASAAWSAARSAASAAESAARSAASAAESAASAAWSAAWSAAESAARSAARSAASAASAAESAARSARSAASAAESAASAASAARSAASAASAARSAASAAWSAAWSAQANRLCDLIDQQLATP